MSYAEAAASSGPTGPTKVPEVPKIATQDTPKGSVGVISQEEADELRGKLDKSLAKGEEKLAEAEKEAKNLLQKAEASLKEIFDKVAANVLSFTNSFAAKSKKEVQNPVVVTQIAVGLGALGAAYVGFLERGRIFGAQHTKSAVTAHAAIITGFVLLDGFLFNKYYPKYDKK